MKELNSQKIQNKLRNKFLKNGVRMIGPETIFFSNDTKIGRNVTIEPYVVIGSKVKIGNNVTIKSFSHLEGARLERNVTIGPYSGRTFSDGTLLSAYDSRKESFYTPMDLSNVKIALDFNNAPRLIEADVVGKKQFFVYFSELEQDMKVYENSGDVEGFGNNGQWPWTMDN